MNGSAEGERGILFDVTSRGDSQNHREYARRLFEWNITTRDAAEGLNPEDVRARDVVRRDYLHIFNRSGRRVTRSDMEPDDWKEWRIELAQKLDRTISFFYGNFAHGVRRCVIDGVEPTDNAADSFQLHLFEYVYHQILRKDSEWVARDLFRVRYRANADFASQHAWNCEDVGCVLLHTSHEVMLEELLSRRIESGDLLSNANTIILMGRTREGNRMGRALFVAKHRGSACDDAIVPFDISESGLRLGRSP